MERRKFIGRSAAASAALFTPVAGQHLREASPQPESGKSETGAFKPKPTEGVINHSVCYWCYGSIPLDTFLGNIAELGIGAIDLVGPEEFPLLKKHGIHASMCWGAGKGIVEGWNDPRLHDELVADYNEKIPIIAEAGYTNLICFSGNRNGMNDLVGLQNCVEGLSKIIPTAEKYGVVLQMELLNSKVDHKDYMCDNTLWGVELCRRLGTDHFKLLYDIYHMQIMEGDVIRNIREYHPYFGHYHTGGNPGRHEIDETQELYYPAIMRAIAATGFTGHVAQEFIPSWEDKLAALKQGIEICDI
ncbi:MULTISPECIES: hydroxypyruvate isomerase family protein [unclassified Robiginitalea]|uniref:hydroxypyruvate isomerase family protein n=1 Tax=Robiginitalea TaxID=252306 RepID=UPI00234A482D|nr:MULTISPECIES: TIM barrel protein [unclassified Robiginitalea]MDC6353659.1 TIM barrel protein [Robiginitalea sp. PM2]MDC6375733.1 TIM barrel protein [Robiginitalea sp. SP8]